MDMNDNKEVRGSTFWKKINHPVPGRASLMKNVRTNLQPTSSSASFQDFQESVSDAWCVGDDEFCDILDVKISKQVVRSTAQSVINSHRNKILAVKTETQHNAALNPDIVSKTASRGDQLPMVHCPTGISIPHHPPNKLPVALREDSETVVSKLTKFQRLFHNSMLSLEELRHLSWSGIPDEVRPVAWRLLAGYLPTSLERRQEVIERKRMDYCNLVKQYFDTERNGAHKDTYRQIHIDIPRMSPMIALFQQKTVQEMFERILFIWAIRHPASGYVQGMNDLVTPFFIVFLREFIPSGRELDSFEVDSLPKEHQDIIEADSFWCLSRFLEGIQDNYIFAQLGIQLKVNQLKELIQRIDDTLHDHIHSQGIDYLQFTFRWLNNLLTRELPLRCCIRLWDTYLAESDNMASFQLYVCAAFLLRWRRKLLLERDFQGLMVMLQNLPTQSWTDSEIGVLVAEAYRLKFTFADAPNHFQCSGSR